MRERASMTQQQLAEAAGMSLPNVKKLEGGAVQLTEENMAKLSAALKCEPWELMEGAPILGEYEKALLTVVGALDEHGKQTLLLAINGLRLRKEEDRLFDGQPALLPRR